MLERPNLSFRSQRDALAQAASTAAVDSTYGQAMQSAQGLIRDAAVKGQQAAQATIGNGVTAEALAALWAGRNSGMDASTQPMPNNGQAPQFNSTNESEQYIYQGLLKRGFSPEEAQASILNFKDESGLNPVITEGAPNVHGTRGQGLYQLTDTGNGIGRRTDYLNFVKQNGYQNPWDIDSQLDFFKWETDNTEKAAWDRVRSAQGVGAKASAMVENFLRPAKEHRITRQNKYMSLGY